MKRRSKREIQEDIDRSVVSMVVDLIRMEPDMYFKAKLMLLSDVQEDSSLSLNEKERWTKFLDIIFKKAEENRPLLIEMKEGVTVG